METSSEEDKKVAEEVCKYCSLQVDMKLLPKIAVRQRRESVYAVLYNPYSALNPSFRNFSYIYYRDHPEEGKFALVCREEWEKYITPEGERAMRVAKHKLEAIRNGKTVWSYTQGKEEQGNILQRFIRDNMNGRIEGIDMLKYEVMDFLTAGMSIASREQRKNALQQSIEDMNVLSESSKMLAAETQKYRNVMDPRKSFIHKRLNEGRDK